MGALLRSVLFLALLLPLGAGPRAAVILSLRQVVPSGPGDPVPAGTLLEYEIRLDRSYQDPFDPRKIRVRAGFLPAAEGAEPVVVDAFWFQDYRAEVTEGGAEVLEPVGEPAWRVRWRPVTGGTYRVAAEATDADGTALSETASVWVAGDVPDPFVRVRRDGGRGFTRGARPWVPFGFNACWAGAGGTGDYGPWMERLAGGWTRKWMTSFDGTALEWKAGADGGAYGGLGAYNLKAGWRLDRILDLAERHGVALQLVLQQHSQFEADMWSSWADNPWNAANGGPCATSMEFFTNSDVVSGFDRRVRYIVARFAHSPALMAWELWNEVDLVGGYDREAVALWSHGRVEALRAADPYGHPVTTSYALPAFADQDWGYEGYDFAQLHTYLAGYWDVLEVFGPQLQAFGKPVVVGEFGVDFLGEANLRDTDATHVMNASLLSVMLGYAGGAMSWWWDGWLAGEGRWEQAMRPAARLAALGVEDCGEPLAGVSVTGGTGLRGWAVRVPGGALAWLHDEASEWDRDPAWVPVAQAGVRVELAGLVPGDEACRGTWRHAAAWEDGEAVEGGAAEDLPGGGAALAAPVFTRDLLVRVQCAGGPAGDEGGPADGAVPDAGPDEAPADGGGDDGSAADETGGAPDEAADIVTPGDTSAADGPDRPGGDEALAPRRRSGGCSASL